MPKVEEQVGVNINFQPLLLALRYLIVPPLLHILIVIINLLVNRRRSLTLLITLQEVRAIRSKTTRIMKMQKMLDSLNSEIAS